MVAFWDRLLRKYGKYSTSSWISPDTLTSGGPALMQGCNNLGFSDVDVLTLISFLKEA